MVYFTYFDTVSYLYRYANDSKEQFEVNCTAVSEILGDYHKIFIMNIPGSIIYAQLIKTQAEIPSPLISVSSIFSFMQRSFIPSRPVK